MRLSLVLIGLLVSAGFAQAAMIVPLPNSQQPQAAPPVQGSPPPAQGAAPLAPPGRAPFPNPVISDGNQLPPMTRAAGFATLPANATRAYVAGTLDGLFYGVAAGAAGWRIRDVGSCSPVKSASDPGVLLGWILPLPTMGANRTDPAVESVIFDFWSLCTPGPAPGTTVALPAVATGPWLIMTLSEFSTLPRDAQSAYAAGAIDGFRIGAASARRKFSLTDLRNCLTQPYFDQDKIAKNLSDGVESLGKLPFQDVLSNFSLAAAVVLAIERDLCPAN